jgi:DNA-directed RNA polymerase subunit RPC12/RpoP
VSDFEDKTTTDASVSNEALDKDFVNSDVAEDMSVYECKTCGGEVVTLNTTMATICPYCGEAISITSKSVGDFRPELCIPFAKDKKTIMELYKDYVDKSFLTPKAFKEQSTIEKIQGLFTPFYLHSMKDHARHTFEGERVSSSRRGYDKITTHKVYKLSIEARGEFEKVPTDASVKIANTLMDAVEPFNYNDLKAYNPAYMAGFLAEQTDDDMDDMVKRVETRVKSGMEERAKSQFSGYQGMHLTHQTNDITERTATYAMLPVWLLNVNHNGQKYTFAVNGQTGKVVGKLPIDKLKLTLLGIGAFAVIDVIAALLLSLG